MRFVRLTGIPQLSRLVLDLHLRVLLNTVYYSRLAPDSTLIRINIRRNARNSTIRGGRKKAHDGAYTEQILDVVA